jgi:iron complex outermembrane recepter protein
MTTPFRVRCLLAMGFLGSATLIAYNSAAAEEPQQTGSDTGVDRLEQIVVTASKRSENLQDVPVAVTALTGEDIVRQGIVQFSDYMDVVPGLGQISGGSPGHSLVVMRGLTTGILQSTPAVSFLVDDVPFTVSQGVGAAANLIPDPDLMDIERIEVLKGPQGTLYGASSLGGLIKIVSRRPTADAFSADFRESFSSAEPRSGDPSGTGYAARASLNIPLVTGMVALRLDAFHRIDPGYTRNVGFLGTSFAAASQTNKTNVSGGKLALRVQPTSNLDIELWGLIQDMTSPGSATVDFNPATLTDAECRYCYAAARGAAIDTKYRLGSLVVNWTLPAGTLTNSLAYARYSDSNFIDLTGSIGILNSLLSLPVPANTATISNGIPSTRKTTEELRFVANRLGQFEGIAGLYYTHEDNENDSTLLNELPPTLALVPPPFGNINSSNISGTYSEYAVFADLTYYLRSNLDFTVGGRYTHNSQDASTVGDGLFGAQPLTLFHSSESPSTYLATLRYRPTEQLNTYARLATGYRPGGPQVSAGPGIPTSFKHDTTQNYELGVKGRGLNDTVSANLAVYYIKWKDIQLNQFVDGLQFEGNGGHATSKGVEADIQYLPLRGLTLQLTGAYNRSTTDSPIPSTNTLLPPYNIADPGDPLPYAPKFTGSAAADYVFPINSALRGGLGFTYAYQGSQHSNWARDQVSPDYILPSYSTLALRAGVEWSKYSVWLRASNVTNSYAYTTEFANNLFPGQGALSQSAIIAPRTITLEFSAKFDPQSQ